jgi:hypothetical protein
VRAEQALGEHEEAFGGWHGTRSVER